MFDIGFWELSLIAVIALLILGPDRLPRVARTAGLWIGKMKKMVADVKSNIDEELRVEELNALKQAGEDLKEGLSSTQKEMTDVGTEFKSSIEKASVEAEDVDLVSAIRESAPKPGASPKSETEPSATVGPVQAESVGTEKKAGKKTKRKTKKKAAAGADAKTGLNKPTARKSTAGVNPKEKKGATQKPRSKKTPAQKTNEQSASKKPTQDQPIPDQNPQDQSV